MGCFHVARSAQLREDGVCGGSPRPFFHSQLGNFSVHELPQKGIEATRPREVAAILKIRVKWPVSSD